MTPCTPLTDQFLDFRDLLQCDATFEILTDTHRPRHPWEAGVSFNSSVLYLDPPEVEK